MRPAFRILPVAALLLFAATCGARADTRVLFTLGSWRVFGGTMRNGLSVCGMSSYGSAGDAIQIKHFGHGQSYLIQLEKLGWVLPPGQGTTIMFRFDQTAPLRFRATGMGDTVEFNLAADRIDWFLEDLRYARVLSVTLPDSGQPDWMAVVSGAGPAIGVFQKCLQTSRRGGEMAPIRPGQMPSSPPADLLPRR